VALLDRQSQSVPLAIAAQLADTATLGHGDPQVTKGRWVLQESRAERGPSATRVILAPSARRAVPVRSARLDRLALKARVGFLERRERQGPMAWTVCLGHLERLEGWGQPGFRDRLARQDRLESLVGTASKARRETQAKGVSAEAWASLVLQGPPERTALARRRRRPSSNRGNGPRATATQ